MDNINYHKKDAGTWTKYGISKAGNVMHAHEYATRYGKDGIISVVRVNLAPDDCWNVQWNEKSEPPLSWTPSQTSDNCLNYSRFLGILSILGNALNYQRYFASLWIVTITGNIFKQLSPGDGFRLWTFECRKGGEGEGNGEMITGC